VAEQWSDGIAVSVFSKPLLALSDAAAWRAALGVGSGGGGATNLAVANRTSTALDVTSDTGTDATLPLATDTLAGLFSAAQFNKLAGIAAGATVNSTDSFLLARGNHTGTQAAATISDFAEVSQDLMASTLVAGSNITLNYDDALGTITIASSGSSAAGWGPITASAGSGGTLTITIPSTAVGDFSRVAVFENGVRVLPSRLTRLSATSLQITGVIGGAPNDQIILELPSGLMGATGSSAGTAIATIAALRAETWAGGRPADIILRANRTLGDGGGAFYWDSGSTATDDNINIIKETAVATGRWRRRVNTLAPIAAEGADASTVAAQLQAAVDASPTGGHITMDGDRNINATVTSANRYFNFTGAITNITNLAGSAVSYLRRSGQAFSLRIPFGFFLGNNEFFSSEDNTHTDSRATATFVRESVGSGANGPSRANLAGIFSSIKTNFLTSIIDGEVDAAYFIVRQGQKADAGGNLIDLEKVAGDTGGYVGIEIGAKWINSSGAVQRRVQTAMNYGGQSSAFYGSSGTNTIGFWAEAQVGTNNLSAFMADQVSGASFENILLHTTGRDIANTILRIDNGGRIYGNGAASASAPTYSWQNDPDTGIRRAAANQVSIVTGGVDRCVTGNSEFYPAIDNAIDLGLSGIARWRNLFVFNSPTVGSDQRDKIEDPNQKLGLEFIMALRPVAWRNREGGRATEYDTVIKTVERPKKQTVRRASYEEKWNGAAFVRTEIERDELESIFEEFPIINQDGNPVMETVPLLDAKGKQVFRPLPKERGKKQEYELVTQDRPVIHLKEVMETVEVEVQVPREVSKEGKRVHHGFMAQEVKAAIDQINAQRVADGLDPVDFGGWVKTDINDPDSREALRYEQLIAPLVAAVQELTARVAELEAK
jgi:hypothetical protein